MVHGGGEGRWEKGEWCMVGEREDGRRVSGAWWGRGREDGRKVSGAWWGRGREDGRKVSGAWWGRGKMGER